MNSLNFLYYSFGVGFLILVGFLSYAAFNLSNTLKEITSILTKVDDLANDVDELKNGIKNGLLTLISMFVKKGGDKNVKQK